LVLGLYALRNEPEFAKLWTKAMLESLKLSIELNPVTQVTESHPVLSKYKGLPGHPTELLLALVKWLGLQEDVNY